jgi:uncharacterized membrane protein
MSDPSALRLRLFAGLFILILLIAIVNRKIQKDHAKKKFLNIVGFMGMACLIFLIIRSYLS